MRDIKRKTAAMKYVEKLSGMCIEEVLRVKYVDEGKPIHIIAQEINVSFVTVFCWLKLCNVVHRKIEWEEVK